MISAVKDATITAPWTSFRARFSWFLHRTHTHRHGIFTISLIVCIDMPETSGGVGHEHSQRLEGRKS